MIKVLRALVPEPARKVLRGDYNSVKTRFWSNPTEKLATAVTRRVMGGSYLSWYAKRLDRSLAGNSGASLLTNAYFDTGREDLDALIALGLKPHHTLFEFGTGEGRSAQHFAAYLEPGHFSGNEISAERLRRFREFFDAKGLADRKPRLMVTTDNSFDWMDGDTVDFVWSHAVISHMPDDECRDVLAHVGKIMHPGSVAAFVFTEIDGGPESLRYTAKDFFRAPQVIIDWAARYGLVGEDRSDCLRYGTGSHVLKFPLGESGRLRMTSRLVTLRLAPGAESSSAA